MTALLPENCSRNITLMEKINWQHYQKWLGSLRQSSLPLHLSPPAPRDISTNSKDIQPGQWFLPLIGENFDAHLFIKDAVKKSQSGFFYQKDRAHLIPKEQLAHGIAVNNTLTALQAIAQGWRLHLTDLTVIALTGSVGKTTTKEMLFSILEKVAPTLKTEGNFNNEIGVPLTLLRLEEKHRYAVIELGARHKGDIRLLTKITSPNIAACLNVGTAHLGEFGSEEILCNTKLEIFRESPETAQCVPFHDDQRILKGARKTLKHVVSFGASKEANIQLLGETWLPDGSMRVHISVNQAPLDITLGLAHKAYPINVTAAVAMAYTAGLNLLQLKGGLANFRGIPGRYISYKLKDFTLIDDCYNANPDSMVSGIDSILKSFPQSKYTFILGDMLELGPRSKEAHTFIGKYIAAQTKNATLVTIGTMAQDIKLGAIGAGLPKGHCLSFHKVEDLISANLPFSQYGDILYVKASNGIALNKLINFLRQKG